MKKTLRRNASIAIAFLVGSTLLVGCGGNDAAVQNSPEETTRSQDSAPRPTGQSTVQSGSTSPDLGSSGDATRSGGNELGAAGSSRQSVAAGEPHLVGKEVCRECHADNFALHAEHGHSSTFALMEDTDYAQRFAGRSFNAGEEFGTYTYKANGAKGLSAILEERFGNEPFPLQYVLGSGHHAVTLLTLLKDSRNQPIGVEHRASWFSAGDRLALTPGHENNSPHGGASFFGDLSSGEPLERCIYCHTTSARVEGDEIRDLVPSVNCEKCHGPGSEHVRQARASKSPPPYSVGRADWDSESEMQLCGDCHRLPKAITEKELREYPDLLVRFQPIGLLRSKCYLESEGKLKCTTCHPPHTSLHEISESEHVDNCIACHQPDVPDHVVCPVSPDEGCIKCHMRSVTPPMGMTFHDHWIRNPE